MSDTPPPVSPAPVSPTPAAVTPALALAPALPSAANQKWLGAFLVVSPVLMLVLGYMLPDAALVGTSRLWSGLMILALLALFFVAAGRLVTGHWGGIFIDESNRISLARFQTVLWTLVILAGFATIALANAALECTGEGCGDPLAIQIPQQIWLLLGISVTSLVGSPLVLSTKTDTQPDAQEATRNLNIIQQQNKPVFQPTNDGLIVKNQHPTDARWIDLLKGEETGTAPHLELAKIQMLFFTLIIVLTYAVSLVGEIASDALHIGAFPALDQSLVWLLGISHAAYLTNQAVPHSQTARP